MKPYDIHPYKPSDLPALRAHLERHRAESGRGEAHFLPFARHDPDGPKGIDPEAVNRSLDEPGWQRWFVAIADDGRVAGQVDLRGDGLKAGLHRCELGIGIERPHRGQGLGRRLMETAIGFAREAESLDWLDLRVFAHNTAARALYRELGFVELGTVVDRFRVDGQVIDDVMMTLKVGRDR